MQPEQTNYLRNHQTLLRAAQGSQKRASGAQDTTFALSLGRILVDRAHNKTVPFEGDTGIEAVLWALSSLWPTLARVEQEGHLVGLRGTFYLADASHVTLVVTLDAGGQLVCTVGPSASVEGMLAVIESLDRQLHVATQGMGCDYGLVAEGYNPLVTSPLDVSLVPRTRWTLLTAHLSQTGRFARDVMRCGCATSVRLCAHGTGQPLALYRTAVALTPLFVFLTDNVSSFRGTEARRNPRMVRSVMWDEVDPTRCGIVPGTFDAGFGVEDYVRWVEGTQPILLIASDGTATSTGKDTLRQVMDKRVLTEAEATRLLRTVHPHARILGGCVELTQADSLRPRMAAGYLAFVKGLFANELAVDSAYSLLSSPTERDVNDAFLFLRKHGWDATVYGQGAARLVDQLLQIARTTLDDAGERALLNNVAELWEARMVPRDSFVHQEMKERRGW